jgi:hypothetical protein
MSYIAIRSLLLHRFYNNWGFGTSENACSAIPLPAKPYRQSNDCERNSYDPVYPYLIRHGPRMAPISRREIEETHAKYSLARSIFMHHVVFVRTLTEVKVAGRNTIVTTAIVFMAALSILAALPISIITLLSL